MIQSFDRNWVAIKQQGHLDTPNPGTLNGSRICNVNGRISTEKHQVRSHANSNSTTAIQPVS